MARRDLHIHACEHGGFAVFGRPIISPMLGGVSKPLAAFNSLGEALGFIQKEMAPEKPKERERSLTDGLPGPQPR